MVFKNFRQLELTQVSTFFNTQYNDNISDQSMTLTTRTTEKKSNVVTKIHAATISAPFLQRVLMLYITFTAARTYELAAEGVRFAKMSNFS